MQEQSFMKALFFGIIAEDGIFPYPEISESERGRLHELLTRVRRVLEEQLDPAVVDRDRAIPLEVRRALGALGIFGLNVPREFGGLGLSGIAGARVMQEIASYDMSLAVMLIAHGATGLGGLTLFGTEEQKQRYLPRLASGELTAAFALTERGSGTDAAAIRTHAEPVAGGGYLLDGEKPWVTNGDICDVVTVFARTSRAEDGHKPRLTAFLVERAPNVTTGSRRDTLGVRGAVITKLRFDKVALGPEALLGEQGKGYKVAMAVLNEARTAIAAAMLGQCRSLVNLSVKRVGKRRSFGRVIGEFPILKDKITRMVADTYAVESMVYLTAGLADRGMDDYSLESAICRVAASEGLWRVVNEAMQIAASGGYITKHALERHLRDARAGFVLDGTNEILRCFIALAGMQGPGKRLNEVVTAMNEPVKGFGLLRDFAVRKVKEALRRERMTRSHPALAREAVFFEEGVDELCKAVDRALREHGKEIAEMQYTQMRIANVAIDLYALAACLSRTSNAIAKFGESGARREIDLTVMFATAAHGRISQNLAKLEHNDDELRKLIASRTYTDGGYPFDVV